jgi:hypothetical protein
LNRDGLAGGLLLAALGWWITFGLAWGNFWAKIGVAVVLITAYSVVWHRPRLRFSPSSIAWGVGSAAALYGIFFAGNALAPHVVPGAARQVGGIYGLGDGSSRAAVALLLLFVTGPCEEIFWRGFFQERLQRRWGTWPGFAAATLAYGLVHVFSRNPMLVLAALTAGAFWGLMWVYKRDLAALVVSHSLWSAVIFAVAPVR